MFGRNFSALSHAILQLSNLLGCPAPIPIVDIPFVKTMALDLTTFEAALKTMYSPDKVNRMSYSKDPFYLMVKKYTNFMGKNFQSDVIYGNGGARSATFSNAQGRSSSTNSQTKLSLKSLDFKKT